LTDINPEKSVFYETTLEGSVHRSQMETFLLINLVRRIML